MNRYAANAYAPETKVAVNRGVIIVSSETVQFESANASVSLPLNGLILRRGGHNNEEIFFEHPAHPGWSIYSSDAGLASDPVLTSNPDFARYLKAAQRSRKSIPAPVIFSLAFVVLILAAFLLLWSQKDRIAEKVANTIPISWEQKFGDKVFAGMASETTPLTNSPWASALTNITSRLLPIVEQVGYEFKFHIKQDTNINAFAIPGGHVVILTGLLEHADTPEEIAGVLAHEIAHVTRRHSLRNIIKSAGLLVVLQAALGDASGLLAVATEAGRYLLEQKFSRDFEREADDAGWTYLIDAKIDPRGMTQFFQKLNKLMADSPMESSLSLINTHPTSQERIDHLTEKWSQVQNKSAFTNLGQWPDKPE